MSKSIRLILLVSMGLTALSQVFQLLDQVRLLNVILLVAALSVALAALVARPGDAASHGTPSD